MGLFCQVPCRQPACLLQRLASTEKTIERLQTLHRHTPYNPCCSREKGLCENLLQYPYPCKVQYNTLPGYQGALGFTSNLPDILPSCCLLQPPPCTVAYLREAVANRFLRFIHQAGLAWPFPSETSERPSPQEISREEGSHEMQAEKLSKSKSQEPLAANYVEVIQVRAGQSRKRQVLGVETYTCDLSRYVYTPYVCSVQASTRQTTLGH